MKLQRIYADGSQWLILSVQLTAAYSISVLCNVVQEFKYTFHTVLSTRKLFKTILLEYIANTTFNTKYN